MRVEDKWEYDRQEEDLQKLLPDGLMADKDTRMIHILGACTDNNIGSIKKVNIKKIEFAQRVTVITSRLQHQADEFRHGYERPDTRG
jgi:hypothetical protein